MKSMFGVVYCECNEDIQESEVLDGIVFCANCHGVIGLFPLRGSCEERLIARGLMSPDGRYLQ